MVLFISALLCLPYLNLPQIWIYLLFLAVSHLLIDQKRVKIINLGQKDTLWMLLLDQFLHILVLFGILFVPAASRIRLLTLEGVNYLYNMTTFINTLTGLIIATYAGAVVIYYVKKTFWDERAVFEHDPGGLIERGLLVLSMIMLKPFLLYLALALIIGVRSIAYLKNSGHLRPDFEVILRGKNPFVLERILERKGDILIDLIASPVIAILVGVAVRGL
jgi:hypothetical protein